MNKKLPFSEQRKDKSVRRTQKRPIYGCSAIIVSLMKLIGIFNIDAIRGGGKVFVQNRSIEVGAQNQYCTILFLIIHGGIM